MNCSIRHTCNPTLWPTLRHCGSCAAAAALILWSKSLPIKAKFVSRQLRRSGFNMLSAQQQETTEWLCSPPNTRKKNETVGATVKILLLAVFSKLLGILFMLCYARDKNCGKGQKFPLSVGPKKAHRSTNFVRINPHSDAAYGITVTNMTVIIIDHQPFASESGGWN